MTTTTCPACAALARMGVQCNRHRTEATSTRLIREATAAGHTLTGTRIEKALEAERFLGARKPVISGARPARHAR